MCIRDRYTKSQLAEQTTPVVSSALTDKTSTASNVKFVDKDLDATELGGLVTWAPPGDVTHVTYYVVYLATSSSGTGKWHVQSDVEVGTNELAMLSDTALGSNTHLVVYTKSSLAEQTTPAALTLSDVSSSVSNVAFVDKDLDSGQLYRLVTWMAPSDTYQVTHLSLIHI